MGITWRALKTALLEILIWLRWSVDVGPCNMLRSLDVLLKIIESILPILSMKGTFYLHVKRIDHTIDLIYLLPLKDFHDMTE